MKKILLIIFVLSISLLLFTGCGSDDSGSTAQPQTTQSPEPQQTQQEESDELPQPPALPEE